MVKEVIPDHTPSPFFGKIYWHEIFKCRILIVGYFTDKRWFFVPENPWFGVRIIKGEGKLSEMKECNGTTNGRQTGSDSGGAAAEIGE